MMVASGFAALGYQIVWTHQGGLWMGHEGAAALAVVAAFFGGLALGAGALSPRIERSRHPARWYAACEALIGLWGVALTLLMAPAGAALQALVGAEPAPAWLWAVSFVGTFVLLLPASAAMGATLPAMERVTAHLQARGVDIAALYAGNTFGAVLGVLAVACWLVPAFGLSAAALVCASLNALCACVVLRWAGRVAEPVVAVPGAMTPQARRVAALLAATGLLGIGYEVLVLRVLSQVSENTVFTFAALLAVYLVGTAIGAALYARLAAGRAADDALRDRLLALLALATALGAAGLWGAEAQRVAVQQALGGGYHAAWAAEASLALTAFGLPTLAMGALFSHQCRQARDAGLGFGRALAINTGAAALAPLVFGVALLPAVGPKAAVLVVVAAYLALVPLRRWPAPAAAACAALLLALATLAPPLQFLQVPEGGVVLSHREGAMAAVSVVQDAQGSAVLRINNRQQEGSSATAPADARQAFLPLMLHPRPAQALFLGLGTGITATAAALDPALQVHAVELLAEVTAASVHFAGALGSPADGARVQVHTADARRYVRLPGPAYDVIVADNFHPARSGSGALYTREHFQAVRERLAPGGLFCQWLPLHQLDHTTLRSIVRSYLEAFPDARAVLATHSLLTPVLGLVSRREGGAFDPAVLRARLAGAAPRQRALGMDDEWALSGSFVAGAAALKRWAAGAPLNTDDHPVVAYLAPRVTYAPQESPADRLLALLNEVDVTAEEITGPHGDAAWRARLSAYLRARDQFLVAGHRVTAQGDVRAMLAQVQRPLLEVLRTSPDFSPAREPLRRMALALERVDPAAALGLRHELDRLVPSRP